MAKTKRRKKHSSFARAISQHDSVYFLKLIIYFIAGTLWVRLLHINIGPFEHLSLPLGLVIGLLFASKEHFQVDRRMEYATLLFATILSFYLPVGIQL